MVNVENQPNDVNSRNQDSEGSDFQHTPLSEGCSIARKVHHYVDKDQESECWLGTQLEASEKGLEVLGKNLVHILDTLLRYIMYVEALLHSNGTKRWWKHHSSSQMRMKHPASVFQLQNVEPARMKDLVWSWKRSMR